MAVKTTFTGYYIALEDSKVVWRKSITSGHPSKDATNWFKVHILPLHPNARLFVDVKNVF